MAGGSLKQVLNRRRRYKMLGKISIDKLKEHPKNNHYFTDLDGEKYEEVKRSIETNGMRDPIKCTTAYTVISGHQRLRIAKELGLEEVPVQIVDVDEWEAEYLLIAENVERRGQAETDPMKKSRIANFLKEYWEVRDGGDRKSEGQNAFRKNMKDIGDTIGESERTTKRILKLNDLIPSLQDLVSEGKLGTTAAEQLAYMSPENQTTLYEVIGERISETTVAKAKEYRHEADEADENDTAYAEQLKQLQKLENENQLLKQELEQSKEDNESSQQKIKQLAEQPPKVITETVEDTAEIKRLTSEVKSYEKLLDQVREEKKDLEQQMEQSKMTKEQIMKMKDSMRVLNTRHSNLKQKLDDIGEVQRFIMKVDEIRTEGMAPIMYSKAIDRLSEESLVLDNLKETVESVGRWYHDMENILNKFHVIEGDVINE